MYIAPVTGMKGFNKQSKFVWHRKNKISITRTGATFDSTGVLLISKITLFTEATLYFRFNKVKQPSQ